MNGESELHALLAGISPGLKDKTYVFTVVDPASFAELAETAVAARLSEACICANIVSAYCHDRLFIPEDRAEEALALLRGIAAEARRAAVEGPRQAAVEGQ